MMAGAYTLSRDGHVRGDFIYRLWQPRTQAAVELVLYFLFFFPGVIALVLAGWKYAARSWRYLRGQHQQPGRHSDLPVQVGHRRRRRASLPPGHRAGVPLHHLPADRRMAPRRRRRRGDWRRCSWRPRRSKCSEAWSGGRRHAGRQRRRSGPRQEETSHDRSAGRRRHAAGPDPGDLPRLSGRLHADGAGRRLRLLRLFRRRAHVAHLQAAVEVGADAWTLSRPGSAASSTTASSTCSSTRPTSVMSNDVLTAIPLFLFMGYIVERANIVDRLFSTLFIATWRVPGAMAVAALITCTLFATATGIVGAVVTLMGLLALPGDAEGALRRALCHRRHLRRRHARHPHPALDHADRLCGHLGRLGGADVCRGAAARACCWPGSISSTWSPRHAAAAPRAEADARRRSASTPSCRSPG